MGKPNLFGRFFGYKYSNFGSDTNGHDVKAFGDTTGKYFMWDASADTLYVVGAQDFTGNVQLDGTFTIGANDTGYDVTFYGATSGKKFFWDESADTAFLTCTVDVDGTITVGVDDTGYDVTFFGATSGAKLLWDESADQLIITGNASDPALQVAGAGSKSAAAFAAAGTVWADDGTPAFIADQMYLRINVGGTVYRIPLWADA